MAERSAWKSRPAAAWLAADRAASCAAAWSPGSGLERAALTAAPNWSAATGPAEATINVTVSPSARTAAYIRFCDTVPAQ